MVVMVMGDEVDELSEERLHTILGRHLMIRPIDRPHLFLFEGPNFKFRSNDLFGSRNDLCLLVDGQANCCELAENGG